MTESDVVVPFVQLFDAFSHRRHEPWTMQVLRSSGDELRGTVMQMSLSGLDGCEERLVVSLESCQSKPYNRGWGDCAPCALTFEADFIVRQTTEGDFFLSRGDDVEGDRAAEDGFVAVIHPGVPRTNFSLSRLVTRVTESLSPGGLIPVNATPAEAMANHATWGC